VLKLFNPQNSKTDVRIFTSLAYDDAKYTSGIINKSGTNSKIAGNNVENAPRWILKSGIEWRYKTISSDIQYSYSGKTFNDAFNTIASADGITGVIPAYHVWDWSCSWQFAKQFYVNASINNVTNEKYFNRRITMYPGPGILPADGRSFAISFGADL